MDLSYKTNGLCGHCGCELNDSNKTIDHILPKSVYHDSSRENLIYLCKSCNQLKANKLVDIDDFYKFAIQNVRVRLHKLYRLNHVWSYSANFVESYENCVHCNAISSKKVPLLTKLDRKNSSGVLRVSVCDDCFRLVNGKSINPIEFINYGNKDEYICYYFNNKL